jgi:hypothetical protein
LVFVEEAAEDGPTPDPVLGEIGGGMVRPGRVQLAAAVGSSPVVAPGVLGQDAAQVAFAEDQHLVGDFGPGGVHEPFRISMRAGAPRRGLHSLDARAGQDRVRRCGALPGVVADQEPEAGGAVTEIDLEMTDLPGGPRPSGCAVTPGM